MFTRYKIKIEDGSEVLYLYLDELNTEFANEFKDGESHTKEKSLKNFIKTNKINFKGTVVKVLLGSLLIGTMVLGNTANVSAQGNTHTVTSGDTLWDISRDYDISVDELKSINNLSTNTLQIGQELIVTTNITTPYTYTVKTGDNLWNLARQFNTTENNIRQLNNLTTDTLQIGQELIITSSSSSSTYTVKTGDNLWNLARDFDTTVDDIRQLNNLTTDTLQIGQELIITSSSSSSTYTVKPGDNLWNLARDFNTTIDNIRELNSLTSDTLQIGQELIINQSTNTSTYTVKSGDNLWNLAIDFNTTVDSIRQLNNLTTDTLQIGQELMITGDTTTSNVYIVKSGDTLWDLAREYNTTVTNIRSTNNLTSDTLYIGQELEITANTETPDTVKDSYIRIKRTSGEIQTIELEEYIVGVVASEMDDAFHMEALKAQSLAARTYAVELDSRNEIILTTDSHQVYKDETELRALWGNEYDAYIQRIKQAVVATKGEVITYQGEYIEALYFSTSNGKTEEPSFVWGGELPYLASVDSSHDVNSREYLETKSMSLNHFTSSLGLRNSYLDVKVLSYTSGDRIDKIDIGGTTFNGIDVKSKLGLRSTDFTIEIKGTTVYITQRGFGHGVGMSQYGAHFMGQEGYSYKDIIHHYYQNVDITQR
ncbi:stage II sporulation protein D [Mycoplasmatota bacterium WC44]